MPKNAKLVGLEWVWVCSNLASSGEPPPLLHKTILTTEASVPEAERFFNCWTSKRSGKFAFATSKR